MEVGHRMSFTANGLPMAVADEEQTWGLQFNDPQLEAAFATWMDGERNHRVLKICWLLCSVIGIGTFFGGFYWQRFSDDSDATKVTAWVLVTMIGFAQLLILAPLVNLVPHIMYYETLAIMFSVVIICLRFFSSRHRMKLLMGEEVADDSTSTDTDLLLLLTLLVTMLHTYVDVRSSRSWVVPATAVITYASLSTHSGLCPHGYQVALFNIVFLAPLCYFAWRGRYHKEWHERETWLDNRRLTKRFRQFEETHVIRLKERFEMEEAEQIETTGLHDKDDTRDSGYILLNNSMIEIEALMGEDGAKTSPNDVWGALMRDQTCDMAVVIAIATKISEPDYDVKTYLRDVEDAFPELKLFLATIQDDVPHMTSALSMHANSERTTKVLAESVAVEMPPSNNDGGRKPWKEMTVAQRKEFECQRCLSSFLTVYWMLRLNHDGKRGFAMGLNKDCTVKEYTKKGGDSEEDVDELKRTRFLDCMDWALIEDVVVLAGCKAPERIACLLCLTAITGAVRPPDLRLVLQPEHAPFYGYQAGEVLNDVAAATCYLMTHFVDLVPSFAALPQDLQQAARTAARKMDFNAATHVGFCQAELPPGLALTNFKAGLKDAAEEDIGLYFLHWLTDVAGADATPIRGAERLVLRCPLKVLNAMLVSFPFLKTLGRGSETAVTEAYLEARWKTEMPSGRALPEEPMEAITQLRLTAMAHFDEAVLTGYAESNATVQHILQSELVRTGVAGPDGVWSRLKAADHKDELGPAFCALHSSVMFQRCHKNHTEMALALRVLAAVYHAGRTLWVAAPECVGSTVRLDLLELKSYEIAYVVNTGSQSVWVLVRESDDYAVCRLTRITDVNAMVANNTKFCVLDILGIGAAGAAAPGPDEEQRPAKPNFHGKWTCKATWGLEEFLKDCGFSLFRRKAAMSAPWPSWEFQHIGDQIVFTNHGAAGVMREEFIVGGAPYSMLDGWKQSIDCRAYWLDDCMIHERDGPQGRFREERYLDQDGKLQFVLRSEQPGHVEKDLKWGRTFVKITA